MRFSTCTYLKQIYSISCNHFRQYNVLSTPQNILAVHRIDKTSFKLSSLVCVYYSDSKKHLLGKKADAIKDVLEQKKEQIKETEHRIRQKGVELVRDLKQQKEITGQKFKVKKDHLVKDILETRAKVREKIEEVVEKENVFTVPNILCVTRIVMSPYLGYVILQDNYNLALGLLIFAGVTDLLDGWIARNWDGQASKMGSFLDPMADKVLIATLFISLTWQNLIPLPLTLLIVARDAALVAAGFVIRYISLPPPKTLSRYFDVTHATAQLAPTFISKMNTAIQLLLVIGLALNNLDLLTQPNTLAEQSVGTTLASPVFGYVDHPALHALCGLTAASTIVSALSYLISKDTYRVLKKKL